MSELKRCPFCGNEPVVEGNLVACNNLNCPTYDNYWTDPMIFTCDQWNTRPIEDALQSRIAALEAENNRLAELLHNELSSVEIATDLGNKRWVALNDIYENGEKHNANWCKRKAQEGLGIK